MDAVQGGCCIPEVKAGGDEASGNLQPLGGCRNTAEGARFETGVQIQAVAFSLGLKVCLLPALHVKIPVPVTGAVCCDLSGP